MNEQIKELAEQAGPNTMEELNANRKNVYVVDVEKFAELIVRECADIALWQQGKGYDVSEMIKKHFGFEE